MRRLVIAAAALLALVALARAQIWIMSPANQTGHGISTPLVPCGAGQLDFSVSTGCNLVFAGH